jgi:hypothetical protein
MPIYGRAQWQRPEIPSFPYNSSRVSSVGIDVCRFFTFWMEEEGEHKG